MLLVKEKHCSLLLSLIIHLVGDSKLFGEI